MVRTVPTDENMVGCDKFSSLAQAAAPHVGESCELNPGMRAASRLTALGEMTVGIVHDFNNVLAVVEAGLRLAARAEQLEQIRDLLSATRVGLDRGTSLMPQLMAFAKEERLEPCAGDANKLLSSLGPLLKCGAGPRVRVALNLAADLPHCLLDPSQFNAAVLNLILNSRDAMPNGGEIRITTAMFPGDGPRGARTYVRVRVQDEGLRMSDEVIQHIFDPFFTTKGKKGNGLGLPQVYAFMRSIGGDVSVRSALGRGTTFDLLFHATT